MDLIQVLCDKINAENIHDFVWKGNELVPVPFSPESIIMKDLKYLPSNNVERMIDHGVYCYGDIHYLINDWKQSNLLSFRPYVLEDAEKCPVLALAWNCFIVLNGDMHFELVRSLTSLESLYLGSFSLEPFKGIQPEHALSYCRLLYAVLFEVGMHSRQFRKLLVDDVEVIDQYIVKLSESLDMACACTWSDCLAKVDVYYGSPTYRSLCNYVLAVNKSNCRAVVSIGKDCVAVEVCDERGRHITRRTNIQVYDLFQNYVDIQSVFVSFLCLLSGIDVRLNSVNFIKNVYSFPIPNVRNVTVIDSLSDYERKCLGNGGLR